MTNNKKKKSNKTSRKKRSSTSTLHDPEEEGRALYKKYLKYQEQLEKKSGKIKKTITEEKFIICLKKKLEALNN